jgi:hypothetical protein
MTTGRVMGALEGSLTIDFCLNDAQLRKPMTSGQWMDWIIPIQPFPSSPTSRQTWRLASMGTRVTFQQPRANTAAFHVPNRTLGLREAGVGF